MGGSGDVSGESMGAEVGEAHKKRGVHAERVGEGEMC